MRAERGEAGSAGEDPAEGVGDRIFLHIAGFGVDAGHLVDVSSAHHHAPSPATARP